MGDRIWRALLAIAIGVGALLAGGPAWAHNSMLESSPAKNDTLAKSPAKVTLRFLATLQEQGTSMSVTGPDGTTAIGKVEISGKVVTAPFTGSSAGQYTVEYEVVSADGHVVKGSYRFALRAQAASAAPSVSPSLAQVATAAATTAPAGSPPVVAAPEGDEQSRWLAWIGGAAVLGLILGALISWWRQRRSR